MVQYCADCGWSSSDEGTDESTAAIRHHVETGHHVERRSVHAATAVELSNE